MILLTVIFAQEAPAAAPSNSMYIIAAIPGVVAGAAAYWQSRRATRSTADLERTKVDAGAYERARASYEAAIKELEKTADRACASVERLENIVTLRNEQIERMRERIAVLERLVNDLGGTSRPRE